MGQLLQDSRVQIRNLTDTLPIDHVHTPGQDPTWIVDKASLDDVLKRNPQAMLATGIVRLELIDGNVTYEPAIYEIREGTVHGIEVYCLYQQTEH